MTKKELIDKLNIITQNQDDIEIEFQMSNTKKLDVVEFVLTADNKSIIRLREKV